MRQSSLEARSEVDAAPQAFLDTQRVAEFLRGAVLTRKTIQVSGGASTDKTRC